MAYFGYGNQLYTLSTSGLAENNLPNIDSESASNSGSLPLSGLGDGDLN